MTSKKFQLPNDQRDNNDGNHDNEYHSDPKKHQDCYYYGNGDEVTIPSTHDNYKSTILSTHFKRRRRILVLLQDNYYYDDDKSNADREFLDYY
jgi:hypothetical protein